MRDQHPLADCVHFLRRGTFYTVVVGRLGRTPERCRLPERQDVAKRIPVQTSGGFDGRRAKSEDGSEKKKKKKKKKRASSADPDADTQL